MNIKQVIQLDNNGYFIGLEIAFESPVRPGHFPMPAGCIESEILPEFINGKLAKWNNGSWVYEDMISEEENSTNEQLSEEQILISKAKNLLKVTSDFESPSFQSKYWDEEQIKEFESWRHSLLEIVYENSISLKETPDFVTQFLGK